MGMFHRGLGSGIKLLETTLNLVIFSTLVFVVVQIAGRAAESEKYTVSLSTATEINQSLLQEMRADLLSAVDLFQNDGNGNAYLRTLDMTDAMAAIDSVLPTINPEGVFGLESGPGVLTGNTLMFTRHAWVVEYQCASGNRYALDVYRIVRNYLAAEAFGPEPGKPIGLNLCRWVSEPMVDGNAIDQIIRVSDRIEILEHLLAGTPSVAGDSHPPVHLAWRRGGDPGLSGTFRQIVPGGFLSSVPLAPRQRPWRILRDDGLSSNGLLPRGDLSVASNYAHPAIGVGCYGVVDNREDGFPHGFEVQIIGPATARQILLQLALVGTASRGLPASSSQRVVINTREF